MKTYSIKYCEGKNWLSLQHISTEEFDNGIEATNRFNQSVAACLNSSNAIKITLYCTLVKGGTLAEFKIKFPLN